MARDKQLKVWADTLEAARLSVRAEEKGKSLSEYLWDLIEVGAAHEGEPMPARSDPAHRGHADIFAAEFLDMHFLTAILLRSVLVRLMGDPDADKLMARARVMAHEQAQSAVAEVAGDL